MTDQTDRDIGKYSDIGKLFLERTCYAYAQPSDQAKGAPRPPLELAEDHSLPRVELPPPSALQVDAVNLLDLIESRRTLRTYAPALLSLEELSYLLWCTQGVQSFTPAGSTLRTVPSAGARHPFETYLLINRVGELPAGLYRYLAIDHELLQIRLGDRLADQFAAACLDQDQLKGSAVTFIWTAVGYRAVWRYGQRGYRYMHLDAGHVCQNLYLAAGSIGCGVCAIAAFVDEEINPLLGIDGEDHFTIYLGAVGKRN